MAATDTIGNVAVGILADLTGLTKGLDSAGKDLTAFGKRAQDVGKQMTAWGKSAAMNITAPIVAMGAAIFATATKTSAWADTLMDVTTQTGLSVEALQEWRHVSEIAGTSSDNIEKAIVGLIRRLPQLEEGLGTSTEQLGKLGLSFDDLKKMNPDDMIAALVERLAAMEDPLERNAIGSKLFGGEWQGMAPILATGAQGIASLRREAHDLGLVLDREGIEQAAAFNDEWLKVKEQFAATFRTVGMDLMPVLKNTLIPFIKNTIIPALKKFGEGIAAVIKWFNDLPGPAKAAIGAIVGLLVVGGPLMVAIGSVINAVGLIAAAFGSLATFLAANPIVLAVVGAVAAVAAVATVADAIKGVHDRAEEARKKLAETAEAARDLGTALAMSSKPSDLLVYSLNQIGSELAHLTFEMGEMSQITFEDLTAELDTLKNDVLKLPPGEMAAAWKDGVLEILGEVENLVPGVRKIMDEIQQNMTTAITYTHGEIITETGVVMDQMAQLSAAANAQIVEDAKTTATKIKDAVEGQTIDATRGITPAFSALEAQFNQVLALYQIAKTWYGETSLEFMEATANLETFRQQVVEAMDQIYEETGQVNWKLFDMNSQILMTTGAIDDQIRAEDEAYAALLKEKAAAEEAAAAEKQHQLMLDLAAASARSHAEQMGMSTLSIEEAAEATKKLSEQAKPMWVAFADAARSMLKEIKVTSEQAVTFLKTNLESGIATFVDGLASMRENNLKAKEDYDAALTDIAEQESKALADAAETRRQAQQDLADDLADGKLTLEQYNREYSQIEQDYTTAVNDAIDERTRLREEETAAYESQKKGIDDILAGMLTSFLKAAREQLQLEAAKWAVIAIAEGLALNFIAAGKAALASAAYFAGAAGLALAGYAGGGIVEGALGEPQVIVAHGGEMILNREQQENLFDYSSLAEAVRAGIADALDEAQGGRPIYLILDGKNVAKAMVPLLQEEKMRLGLVTL